VIFLPPEAAHAVEQAHKALKTDAAGGTDTKQKRTKEEVKHTHSHTEKNKESEENRK
jgi:hypothetical protein